MKTIPITPEHLTPGTSLNDLGGGRFRLTLPEAGGGFELPGNTPELGRFLSFRAEVEEEHSLPMQLIVFESGEPEPVFTLRFGLLPSAEAAVLLDLSLMDGSELFPEALPGTLKMVCHGRRVRRDRIEKILLTSLPSHHEVTLTLCDIRLTDSEPSPASLPDLKLVDEFGQNKRKDWPGKTHDLDELRRALEGQLRDAESGYPERFSEYGGSLAHRLTPGTGFFTSRKENGRWHLVDPLGYAFFSMGPDCVGLGGDCRIDGVEKWLDFLPPEDDPELGEMYSDRARRGGRREYKAFSFFRANLRRALGPDWYGKWKKMLTGEIKRCGMNTLGNWSDADLLGTTGIPYVTSLPSFPSTEKKIFRDFPDVLSPEFAENAEVCASALEARKDDPLMIGYFLRNEPEWAFVDGLVVADEALYCPERTVTKERLVAFLEERYGGIGELNAAWGTKFESFESLYTPVRDASRLSPAAARDMHEFSRVMLRAYVEIPSHACRAVDPNHMILGMRWAWISDPDIVTGWENFDVFSINCYSVDPTANIRQVADLGVDLPVMIGEFHFGALDAGLPATGLEGVTSQSERGAAYRYYCERVAAHPNGVGCHYFQCYDQFVLGRFDGENYNIGLFDICSRAYPEMMKAVLECSRGIYSVADGSTPPTERRPLSIPMIAY